MRPWIRPPSWSRPARRCRPWRVRVRVDLAVQFGIDLGGAGNARLTGDDVLQPQIGSDERPAQVSLPLHRAVHLAGLVLVVPPRPGRMRAGQTDGADEQQRGDEHAHQPGPQLALEQHDHRQHQGEHRHQDDGEAGQKRFVIAPDADIEEGQRVKAHDQQSGHRGRDEHRVDGGTAVLGPVHVLQVQDERVLVEQQRRPDTEKDCGQGELANRAVDRQGDHRHPGDQHQDDAEHGVVDVQATTPVTAVFGGHRDVVRLPPFAGSRTVGGRTDIAGDAAGHEEGEDEGDQTPHQRLAALGDEIEVEVKVHG